MASGTSITVIAVVAVVGVVLSTAALVMVILIYSKPEVLGERIPIEYISEPGSRVNCTGEQTCVSNDQDESGWRGSEKYRIGNVIYQEMEPIPYIYTMAFENCLKPYNYLNSKGELKGLMIDLVAEACRRAGQQCVHMYFGRSSLPCWSDKTKRGFGLHNRYFDACVSWAITQERSNVFQFTAPLMAMNFLNLYTNDVSNTKDMITTKKFGYVPGSVASPKCIEDDLKLRIPEGNLVEAIDKDDLRGKLKTGEVSFVILGGEEPEFIKIPTNLKCGRIGGYSIMTRMDSHIPDWFNKVFKEMRDDGTYDRMCVEAEKTHGAAADCLPN